jgi:quinol monooxygenase YgiN
MASASERSRLTSGLFTRFQVESGREKEFETAMTPALQLVLKQRSTHVWFALRFGDSSYGIIDVFQNKQARAAHLAGPVGQSVLSSVGPLLATPARVEHFDVLAHHIVSGADGNTATKGLLGIFRAKEWREAEIGTFLRQRVGSVAYEGQAVASFALAFGERRYGIFSAFADAAARSVRLHGAPERLSIHLPSLDGGAPALETADITAAKIAPADP